MSTIEVLQGQIEVLGKRLKLVEEANEATLNKKLHEILDPLSVLFEEINFEIRDRDIDFFMGETRWDLNGDFSIQRGWNYKIESPKWEPITLSHGSSGTMNELRLKSVVCMGILAEHQLLQTEQWKNIEAVMDLYVELRKDEFRTIKKQICQLNNDIKLIENEESKKQFEQVFNKGTFKLKKYDSLYYGNSSYYDYVNSDEFFWVANPSGKTYQMSYIREYRTNPNYDESGNSIPPIMERQKFAISKKFRKKDVEIFVRGNMKNIVED